MSFEYYAEKLPLANRLVKRMEYAGIDKDSHMVDFDIWSTVLEFREMETVRWEWMRYGEANFSLYFCNLCRVA